MVLTPVLLVVIDVVKLTRKHGVVGLINPLKCSGVR